MNGDGIGFKFKSLFVVVMRGTSSSPEVVYTSIIIVKWLLQERIILTLH